MNRYFILDIFGEFSLLQMMLGRTIDCRWNIYCERNSDFSRVALLLSHFTTIRTVIVEIKELNDNTAWDPVNFTFLPREKMISIKSWLHAVGLQFCGWIFFCRKFGGRKHCENTRRNLIAVPTFSSSSLRMKWRFSTWSSSRGVSLTPVRPFSL